MSAISSLNSFSKILLYKGPNSGYSIISLAAKVRKYSLALTNSLFVLIELGAYPLLIASAIILSYASLYLPYAIAALLSLSLSIGV